MKANLIRYVARDERRAENTSRTADVFRELHAVEPTGVGYLVLELDDGTFLHLVCSEAEDTSGLTSLAAFRQFQDGASDRRVGDVERRPVRIIGAFNVDRFAGITLGKAAHGR